MPPAIGPRLDFYAEFLDTARWPKGEAQIAVHDYLRRKYAQRQLSAIVAVARPAVDFMRIYGDDLFPGVPIVAYGDSDALRDWEPGRSITGALARIDLRATVELILRLQPGTREILVISGTSDSDRWRQSDVRRQLDHLEEKGEVDLAAASDGKLGHNCVKAPYGWRLLQTCLNEKQTSQVIVFSGSRSNEEGGYTKSVRAWSWRYGVECVCRAHLRELGSVGSAFHSWAFVITALFAARSWFLSPAYEGQPLTRCAQRIINFTVSLAVLAVAGGHRAHSIDLLVGRVSGGERVTISGPNYIHTVGIELFYRSTERLQGEHLRRLPIHPRSPRT